MCLCVYVCATNLPIPKALANVIKMSNQAQRIALKIAAQVARRPRITDASNEAKAQSMVKGKCLESTASDR